MTNLYAFGVPATEHEEYSVHVQNLKVYARRAGLGAPDTGDAVAVGNMLAVNGFQVGSRKATLTGLFFLALASNITDEKSLKTNQRAAKISAEHLCHHWYNSKEFDPRMVAPSLREMVTKMVEARNRELQIIKSGMKQYQI